MLPFRARLLLGKDKQLPWGEKVEIRTGADMRIENDRQPYNMYRKKSQNLLNSPARQPARTTGPIFRERNSYC